MGAHAASVKCRQGIERMVSVSYWERLSAEEKSEYQKYSSNFIRAVQKSDARDGYDFTLLYPVQSKNGLYFMAKEGSSEPFAGITSSSKRLIETLQADAGQNYGR